MEQAMIYWGLSLADQAGRKTGEEAVRLFGLAGAKYEAALAINPDMHEALYNWGGALLAQSGLLTGENRKLTLEKAEAILLRAAEIKPSQLYKLACLASVRNEPEQCHELLSQCLTAGTLPPT